MDKEWIANGAEYLPDGRKYLIYMTRLVIHNGPQYTCWIKYVPNTKNKKPKGVYMMKVIYTDKQHKIHSVHDRLNEDINMLGDLIASGEIRRINKKDVETFEFKDGEPVWCSAT
jgi:hypothetical protein